MRSEFLTIAQAGSNELIEKKSRFIGYCSPVDSEAQALEFLKEIRSKHKDATHNCYAYQVGMANEIQRSSDAGEPSGTAGKPILEIIKKSQLKNTAIVVTRYFGGILLGAGGLTRAYGKAAQIAIEAGKVVQKTPALLYSLTLAYPLWGKVENYLTKAGLTPDQVIFLEQVTVMLTIAEAQAPVFIKNLNGITNNTVQIMVLSNDAWLDLPN